jgi:hypothetical protein
MPVIHPTLLVACVVAIAAFVINAAAGATTFRDKRAGCRR